jgi:hypothetical protein
VASRSAKGRRTEDTPACCQGEVGISGRALWVFSISGEDVSPDWGRLVTLHCAASHSPVWRISHAHFESLDLVDSARTPRWGAVPRGALVWARVAQRAPMPPRACHWHAICFRHGCARLSPTSVVYGPGAVASLRFGHPGTAYKSVYGTHAPAAPPRRSIRSRAGTTGDSL